MQCCMDGTHTWGGWQVVFFRKRKELPEGSTHLGGTVAAGGHYVLSGDAPPTGAGCKQKPQGCFAATRGGARFSTRQSA